MSDERFLQDGFDKQLSHVIEECGEVLAAAGKTQRWGLDSVNPLLPKEQQETNEEWLIRELIDLESSISRLKDTMQVSHDPNKLLSCAGVLIGDQRESIVKANARIKELESMNASLKTEMAWAAETIAEWGAYATEYFQNKYDLAGDVARAKRASEIGGV